MSRMTKAHWRRYIEQWKRAGPALERIRREELRGLKYEFPVIDALLEIGDRFGQSRSNSGLVEMQKWFMLLGRRKGLVPKTKRGEPAPDGPANRRKGARAKKAGKNSSACRPKPETL